MIEMTKSAEFGRENEFELSLNFAARGHAGLPDYSRLWPSPQKVTSLYSTNHQVHLAPSPLKDHNSMNLKKSIRNQMW